VRDNTYKHSITLGPTVVTTAGPNVIECLYSVLIPNPEMHLYTNSFLSRIEDHSVRS